MADAVSVASPFDALLFPFRTLSGSRRADGKSRLKVNAHNPAH